VKRCVLKAQEEIISEVRLEHTRLLAEIQALIHAGALGGNHTYTNTGDDFKKQGETGVHDVHAFVGPNRETRYAPLRHDFNVPPDVGPELCTPMDNSSCILGGTNTCQAPCSDASKKDCFQEPVSRTASMPDGNSRVRKLVTC